ncbi:hypothetical protein F5Y06DRAFT_291221 [Hypoxylon sp. FL0890]|nr:hypothetical protein F5Y06DRAFT_291221 [Hypoxylon sp. FL0890]
MSSQPKKPCDGCKVNIPAVDARHVGFKPDGSYRYHCYGCSVIPPAEQQSPLAPYWSGILNHWRPGADSRAWTFIRQPHHPTKFLVELYQLAKYYSYDHVTIMINSIMMERVRHSADKRRYVVKEDWECLLKVAQELGFEPSRPYEILPYELESMNLRRNNLGFLEPGAPHHDDNVKGVCSRGQGCHNILPYTDRVVFTWTYRNRRGCDIIA